MQSTISLRERKRSDTFRDLHATAAELVLDRGLAGVTVEEIADRVGVSQRTFFNYFPTKEDAVLGVREPELTDASLASFGDAAGRDLLTRVVQLFVDTLRTSLVPTGETTRRAVMTAHPELRQRFMARVGDTERLAQQAMEEQPGTLPDTPEAARALLYLAGAVVRFTFQTAPGAISGNDDVALHRAIDTYREVLRTAL